MFLLHMRTGLRNMAIHPTVRFAFSPVLPVPISRPLHLVSLTRPLRSALPRRNFCASVIYNATNPISLATSSAPGNGVAVAADFDEAPVFDVPPTIPSSTASPSLPVDTQPVSKKDEDPTTPPIASFRLSQVTIDRLATNGITNATEVQAGTFNLIYDGKDVIAKSRTGTGKTLAFALPIMERLALRAKERGPRQRSQGPGCIVLAPTRELAKQVAREMTNIGGPLNLSVECFYGGSSYGPQESALRRGLDVVVGTPGRVMDHMERGTLRLGDIQFAVLDEADEMLSMGFAQDVEHIFESLPSKEERQVILFSATVPTWVKGLAGQFQQQGVVTFDAVTTGSKASTTVRHCAVRVPEREEARGSLLADIIAVHSCIKVVGKNVADASAREAVGPSRAIVFTETKREADELSTSGALDGCGAAVLHGDVSQRQRDVTLSQFRKGKFQVLVATDVAARGLDISGVDVVVQYRVPRDAESYIHRAGRTGRAGKSGTAVVMYSDREVGRLKTLERECRVKFDHEAAPAPELALEAAVDVAMSNLWTVDERVRKHLVGRAEDIINLGAGGADTIASLLAMAGRRTRLDDRSVLSGESGMRTLLVRQPSGAEVGIGMALRFINDIGKRGDDQARVEIGLIRSCRDGSAVVDVASEQAVKLLDQWNIMVESANEEELELNLELATGVPALKDSERRRDGGGRGRGGDRRRGDGGRFGSMTRGRDQRRGGGGGGGGGWREDRFDRGGGGSGGRGGYGGRGGGYSGRGGGSRERSGSYGRGGDYGSRSNDRGNDRGYERGSGRGGGRNGSGWRGGGGDVQAEGMRGRRSSQFLEDDF